MRFVSTRKRFTTFFILLIGFTGFSQQSVINTNAVLKDFNNGLELYNNKAYAAAQKVFANINNKTSTYQNSNLKSDASYYDAMCAIKLKQPQAEKKVLNFIAENPNSTKKNTAFFNVANYYFANKKASYSLKWYKKVDASVLSKEEKKELNFKMGYAYIATKNYALAQEKFLPLINDPKYGNDSRYYYGFVAYKLEDFGIAESTLKEIADDKTYSAEITYYLLDISFKAGKFDHCVKVGTELLKTAKRNEISEISKIVGESYFNLEKYSESIPYLKAYTGKKGKWNNTDFYQLGYAYYKQNDFENAINNFNKIIDEKNFVSQNAYYHLGECYLNLDKKTEALNAFKTASEMDFNTDIKQDAALNYAKLSYEAGNPFKSVAEVLQDYLKAYPKSKEYNEINNLVISSFLHQQNYEGALQYLKKEKSTNNAAFVSEVSLYRGIQLFNDSKLEEAISFFIEGKKSSDSKIKNSAKYWQAEALFRLEKYNEALALFTSLKPEVNTTNNEFSLLDYNIGYCYFKLKEYSSSIKYFENFLINNTIETEIKYDAYTRLGDGYYAVRDYKSAVDAYYRVVQNAGSDSDYAQYQIGMSYGFTEDNKDKINALKKVINEYHISSLKDDALYQLANTYTLLKDTQQAHLAYNRLIEKHPNSIFIPKALVRQGLLYYNDNQNDKALERFKQTASKFPNTTDAIEAVTNAKNIYIDNDNLDAYVSWINTLNFVNVTDAELDNTAFTIAEKKYFENKNSSDIIKSLTKYNNDFPNGIHKLKANYYLASTLFKTKDYNNAITHYNIVIAKQNDFSEDALSKLSLIYLEKNEYQNAIPLLVRLELEAYSTENILFAQSNLMKSYYETANYNLTIDYANKILKKDKLDSNLKYDAQILIARSSYKNNDFATAEEYYTKIEQNATGELKTEALYYNAFFKHELKNYEASNKVIENLIANYSSYKYWGVKSYVIMGKNFYGLNDIYQATFVLENIIKNFSQFKDIVADAKKELMIIKQNEAKTNNSVVPIKADNQN
ncbi:tetratricopeptide repeat protein [Polaribacter sargassicola]|uniref:tetratricopeptide repeat protein n=1 Tax=Polaribacter sargassicola TaxID=2836891 RepID=UPI001F2CBB90|nr:tetratricopeptide repeat protein [Polaribacter sp. DS7-9]MCG1035828.1 tetratricopeptide repeat protein [Polaribacter sp. DS7-9]